MKLGRRTKRILGASGAIACFFLLAHTGPAKSAARRLLASALGGLVGGEASIEALDYRLWRGEVELDGLAVAPEDGSYQLTVHRVRLQVTGLPQVSLEIVEPELELRRLSEGSDGAQGGSPLAFLRYLGALRIERGTFELLDTMRFEDVEADVLESSEEHRLALHAARGRVRVSNENIALGPLDADAILVPEKIRLVSAAIHKDASFVRAEGELAIGRPLRTELHFEAALEASFARLVNEALELRGVVTASGRASFEDGRPRVEARLRSEELGFREIVARDLSGRAELENGMLRIDDLEAEAFGGRFALAAALSLNAGGDRVVDLSWADVDPKELALALVSERLPLSSRSAGAIHLDLEEWGLLGATGSAEIRLAPVASTALPSAEGTLTAALGSGVVTLSPSTVKLSNPRASVDVAGTIGLDGDLALGVSARLAPGSIPSLPFRADGDLDLDGDLAGTLVAPSWTARLSSRDLVVENEPLELTGTVAGDFESATVDRIAIEGGGGRLEVKGIAPLNAERKWSLDLSGSGVELPELGPLRVVVAEASGHLEGPAASPDATASLRLDPVSVRGREGEAQLFIQKLGSKITLDELRASIGSRGRLVGSGSYDIGSDAIEAKLDADGLALEDLVPGLEGRAAFELSLEGTRSTPEGFASLRVNDLALHDRALPEAVITARAAGGRIAIEGGLDGTSALRGTLALQAPFPLHLETDLGSLPWNELVQASGLKVSSAFSLRAAGSAVLDAELSEPRKLRYQASFEELGVTTIVGTATSTPVHVEGDTEALSVRGLDLEGRWGRLSLSGTLPFVEKRELDVVIHARVPLETLQEFSSDLEVQGEAVADLTLTGSWIEPHLLGDLSVADSHGRFQKLVWSGISITAHASRDRLDHFELRGNLLDGRIDLEGQLPLGSRAAPGRVKLSLDHLDLAPLLHDEQGEMLALLVSLGGELDVAGPSLSEISGSGELRGLSLRAREKNIELSEPVAWRLDAERFDLSPVRLQGQGSDLSLRLRRLDLGDEPRVEASVTGAVDLSAIDALLGIPELSTEGRAQLDVDAAYSREGLVFSGSGALTGGRLTLTRPRFTLSNVSGGFELQGSKIVVSELSASAGSGTLTGGGFVDLAPGTFGLDLRAEARRLPLELMDGLRVETSGTVRLASTDDAFKLSGNLSLDRGLLTREIDDEDMGFSGQQVALRDPTESAGFADRLLLDVTITTRRNLVVENSLAQLELAGNVTIGGTLTEPEVGGIINVLPDGTIQIGRNRFQIRQGRADLRGFPLSPLRLELAAVTRVGQTLIQIDLEGDSDDLQTRLTAPESPELTEGDLASLLVTGRTLEQAGEGGQQIATTWMMASLADLVHEGLGKLITYGPPPGAGPLILAEEADPTSRLTLGVPLTERLSATYSIALNDAEKRLWILDYRVARNIWLRGIQENSSDYSIGVSQRSGLDLPGRARTGRLESAAPGSVERLAEVSLEGAPEAFEWKPDIHAGQRYDYWSAQDEARRLTSRLVEKGYPSAVVEVAAESDEAQRVHLAFQIRAGKPTKFIWKGDDPGKDLRRSIERAWDGRIPETFLLPDLAERARTELAARRYYLARVDAHIEEDGETRRVVFDVARGPRGERVEIRFEGNEALDQEALRAVLPRADDPALFLLLDRHPELERGIRLRYASEGFLDASLGRVEKNYDEGTGTFRVTLPVEEGSITRVASLAFGGSTAFEKTRLEAAIGVSLDDPVDFPVIRRGAVRIRTLYREEGFPDVRLRTDLSRTVDGLQIVVGIEEGARARVGDIRVVGNVRTRESVIRGELTFEEGDPVRITDFQESQKRLYDLGILRTADVRVDPAEQGQSQQDVIVRVDEKPDLDVNYGIRYNVLTSEQSLGPEAESKAGGLEGVARLNVVNPVGFGGSAGFSVFFQDDYQLYRGSFRLPMGFGKRITTELILDTERDQNHLDIPGLDLRRDSVTLQQTKKLRDLRYDKLALQWNVSYARYRGQTVDRESGSIIGFETSRPRFGISFIDDRRDSFANPTRGRFWNVTLQYTPAIWGAGVSYYRLYGQFFYYYPIRGQWVWASGVRLGFAPGEAPFLLIDDRFEAGGANSVRGFKQNTLGPSVTVPETGEQVHIGGQAVGVFNQELRFPLYKSLHGGLFWDVGNVFARASDFRIPDLRQSVGFGLRYVLSFGAIRLDWARVLHRREGESSSRLHFSFGYAF